MYLATDDYQSLTNIWYRILSSPLIPEKEGNMEYILSGTNFILSYMSLVSSDTSHMYRTDCNRDEGYYNQLQT